MQEGTNVSVTVGSEIRPLPHPPILVKGVKEGLLFILDDHCNFQFLIEHLEDLLGGATAGLFDGATVNVFVDYGERSLVQKEIQRILSVFLNKKNFVLREWGYDTRAHEGILANHRKMGSDGNFQTIFKGTVRAGQRLVFQGDVVVIGDVNPGGEVVASGDIYVFGRLRGITHAGVRGNRNAVIAAAEFEPMQLRIADIVSRAPEVDGRPLHTTMEFAYLSEEGMAVDKLQYRTAIAATYHT
ncbi:septum site-determining protein MinC [Alicyclobacillaceae bacterium I2511]|nr:septum site-determining protein MinC [Alicyclobacillaceae bacterium I2511]